MYKIGEQNITKSIVVQNMFWKFGERIGGQLVTFVVSIILARILMPEDYGLIAMVLVFTNIANVFVVSGIGQSLIQKKNIDNLDFSSIFFLSLSISVLLYGIIYFTAPLVSQFYGYLLLTPIMRIMGISLFCSAINTVQNAYVARNMIFRRSFFSSTGASIVSFLVGIVLAINGFGVWALVVQQLFSSLTRTVILWFTVKWRPTWQFSFNRVKTLFSYGWKLQMAGLLNVLTTEIRNLIIGKLYRSEDLAFYNRGNMFPSIFADNIIFSISDVIFPVASKYQDTRVRLKELTRTYVRVTSYFIFPIMVGLAVTATSLVKVLLTDKWLPVVPYLRIATFSFAIIVIQIAIQDAIKAVGRSDIFLYIDIFRKIIGLITLFIFMRYGVLAIALTTFITGPISVIMIIVVSKKMLAYKYVEHFNDNFPILLSSLLMGVIVFSIQLFNLSSFLTLLIQVTIGIIVYCFLSRLFNFEGYNLSLEYLNKLKNKIKNGSQ